MILMSRLRHSLSTQAFIDFMREAFPCAVDHIATDGTTSWRSLLQGDGVVIEPPAAGSNDLV